MSRIWRQVDVNMRLICIDNPNQQAELCVAKTARSQTEIKKKKKKKSEPVKYRKTSRKQCSEFQLKKKNNNKIPCNKQYRKSYFNTPS